MLLERIFLEYHKLLHFELIFLRYFILDYLLEETTHTHTHTHLN